MFSDDSFLDHDTNIIRDSLGSRKIKTFKKRINPFEEYTDKDFEDIYRFNKKTAMYIVNIVRQNLEYSDSKHGLAISPEIMVMSTIRYIAKGTYQKDIGKYDHIYFKMYEMIILYFEGDAHVISQQSVTEIVRKVTSALAKRISQFISFPSDPERILELKRGFYKIAQFPQCVGVIDCTHIKIKTPGGELGGRFRCRKGFYFLNVQVICDAEYRILDIVARWRGSAHDLRIWRESCIKKTLEELDLKGCVILGDNGYANSKILLTSFKLADQLSPTEAIYNKKHILTRNTVEQLFGQLKNKFRCCLNGINVDLNTAKNMIIAIAILFNISKHNSCRFIKDCEGINDINDEIDEGDPINPIIA